MESIWTKTTDIGRREALAGNLKADVAVIGGGMAGVLTAYFLKRSGVDVVLIEGSQIGSGQTKNTTAKITSQHNLIYNKLIEDFGEEKAGKYAIANEKAINEFRRIIEEENIDCMFENKAAYLYSTIEEEPLEKECKAAQKLGIDAEIVKDVTLPFKVKAALKFNSQAQFHPLKFLKAIADKVTIYEDTMAKTVEGNKILTDKGTINAEKIVFATHYPFINAPGYYFMRMHQERSYAMALKNAPLPDGMYLGIDKGNSFSFRSSGKYLILGGGGHRTGENSVGGKYDKLRTLAEEIYPKSSEVAAWSAQDCITLDGVPYIGKYSSSEDSWYVATGFKKWGMTTSMVSAMIISDMISGKENQYAEAFSPQRFEFSASIKTLAEDTIKSAKGLIKEAFKLPKEKIDELPRNHGGIVEYNGHKAGVYKDEQGEVFIVSTKCSHLGCQLEWNPDENSWDCPCHGSRYNYNGELIDNPAQENLEKELT
ncbi:MAG: FAD-dependent oxidoreductase [Eubacteriales bacterium]